MITVFTGGYGSGKTEVSLNYALYLAGFRTFQSAALTEPKAEARSDSDVTLIDLDVIKPYFRSREMRDPFKEYGVKLISSLENFEAADVPALSPAIQSAFRRPSHNIVVDLGGDRAGARVLRRFLGQLAGGATEVYLIANPYRPFSTNPKAIAETGRALSEETGLPLAGVVANPHLIDATTPDTVLAGREVVVAGAALLDLPVSFTVVHEDLLAAITAAGCPSPIFPLARFVVPPWDAIPVAKTGPSFGRIRR